LCLKLGGNQFQSPVLSNIYVLPDIRSDIYFEIVGPTAFLSVRTDGFLEVWNKCRSVGRKRSVTPGKTSPARKSPAKTTKRPATPGAGKVRKEERAVTPTRKSTRLENKVINLLDLDVDLPLAGDLDERV
jgi:hypothetical protein